MPTESLLILYSGMILFNTILSCSLWYLKKVVLYKYLTFYWAAMMLTFLTQGVFNQNNLMINLGYSVAFLVALAMVRLLSAITSITLKMTPFYGLMGIAYVLSTYFYYAGAPFWVITLPTGIATALPIFVISYKVITKQWKSLSYSEKGMIISSLCIGAHQLDFPFLRNDPSFASLGFTIAIFFVFALSIFAPAIILEYETQEKARVKAEVDVAKKIQMEILPKKPKINAYELTCYMKSAEEVGGDYYDIINFGEFSWVLLGDVTGHGLGSGLVMFMAQSIMSSILHTKKDISPAELNYLANKVLYQNLNRLNEVRPLTIVSMLLYQSGDIKISGFHDNIYIYRHKTKTVEQLAINTIPFGLGFTDSINQAEFQEINQKVYENDLVFIGTDGITEASQDGDFNKPQFNEGNLITFIEENGAQLDIEAFKEKLVIQLDEYTNKIYHDDLTFIVLKATALLKTQTTT